LRALLDLTTNIAARDASWGKIMRSLKAGCAVLCFLILVSMIWSMSHWNESRGVYDDVCYLRQAHLFQKFGSTGLDTDIARDDDHYLSSKLKAINFPDWSDPAKAPCHSLMPATNKRVIQYPPGTGFALSLFPEGNQVIPLYALATVLVFGFALIGISCARSTPSIVGAATFGCLAIYLMINPAKASYSVAPTLMVCPIAGLLTARLFCAEGRWQKLILCCVIGLLIGLSVNFRLPNLFLASGYFLFFVLTFVQSRKVEVALLGLSFGAALAMGMAPTLIANAINAGSVFSTTYGPADVVSPAFSLATLWSYLTDPQFALLLLAAVWTALLWRSSGVSGTGQAALVTAGNLLVNLAFFFSHPVFTPYYTIPVAMLSLWTLLFASVLRPAEAFDDDFLGRAAKA
jgi:hypothetical protein